VQVAVRQFEDSEVEDVEDKEGLLPLIYENSRAQVPFIQRWPYAGQPSGFDFDLDFLRDLCGLSQRTQRLKSFDLLTKSKSL
jgi:hypothetical protein